MTAHFIALPKLPTALGTAEHVTVHVACLHRIPLNIVSVQGPQLISGVLRAFCRALGTSVSLTSVFHPQSNGQCEQANQMLETSLCSKTVSNLIR